MARCEEFVDLVWYFLRSTDPLVTQVVTWIRLGNGSEEEAPFDLLFQSEEMEPLKFSFDGFLAKELVSRTPVDDWFEVDAERLSTYGDEVAAGQFSPAVLDSYDGTDVALKGRFVGPAHQQRALAVALFAGSTFFK